MTLKNLTKLIILLILSTSLFFAYNFVADKQEVLANTNTKKMNVEVFKTVLKKYEIKCFSHIQFFKYT